MAETEMKRKYPTGKVGEDYECAQCGGIFKRNRSNEDCIKEVEENLTSGAMPEDPRGEYAIVCDDCYKLLVPEGR